MNNIHISNQHEHPQADARSLPSLSAQFEHAQGGPLEPVSVR
jgi:hypothetical protein